MVLTTHLLKTLDNMHAAERAHDDLAAALARLQARRALVGAQLILDLRAARDNMFDCQRAYAVASHYYLREVAA